MSKRSMTFGARNAPAGDPVGTQAMIGPWQLMRRLGEGPHTHVYQARPAGSAAGRPWDYVVKVLRRQMDDEPLAVDLIRREACIGRRVSHPHLVSILAADITEPPYYVVMPYAEGATLRETLQEHQRLDPPHALWIVRQAAQALTALHEEGWLHGDIKPANIQLSSSCHVTVLDLGFARRLDEPGSIVDRPLMGSYSYLAPELFTSSTGADARSDIYSLGVTLYQMLTGSLPFTGQDAAELASAHLQQTPPNPRALVPQLPGRVNRLLKRMLAKEPLRRPQSATELISWLVQLEIETFDERAVAV